MCNAWCCGGVESRSAQDGGRLRTRRQSKQAGQVFALGLIGFERVDRKRYEQVQDRRELMPSTGLFSEFTDELQACMAE